MKAKTSNPRGNSGRGRLIISNLAILAAAATAAEEVRDLGANRELLWDMDRIAALGGGAALTLHHPELREVAILHDAPWEGNICCYHTVFKDDKNFKMYYRGGAKNLPGYSDHQVVCFAESDDGIVWRKPNLGICEYGGSKENNIILDDDGNGAAHNFSPFFDRNPDCPPGEKYKAVAGHGKGGLFGFVSADGIHWRKMGDKPLLTKGAFDSQNIAFWDAARGCYAAYFRTFWKGPDGKMLRGIQWATSPDFLTWSAPKWVKYETEAPNDQLYTNAIHPYDRAPGFYVGFPKRFTEGRCSIYDKSASGIPGVSDGVFMSSRDGALFHRWGEAFLRPGLQHERWVNRNNMIAWGIVQTRAAIPGCPDEISLYATENYYSTTSPARLRRLAIRLDGFVSVAAPFAGGTVTTKPLTFAAAPDGRPTRLLLNASTSGAGHIRCEIRGEDGSALPGFSLGEGTAVFGDETDLAMAWKGGSNLSALAGKTVVLHFEMKDADIFSYRFGE